MTERERMVRKDGITCLHIACNEGHVEIVRELVRVGGEDLLAIMSTDGESCLHIACGRGHLAVVKLLLAAAPNALSLLNMESRTGVTCLLSACSSEHSEIVHELVRVGGKDLLLKTDNNGRLRK